jgi:capsular polysaccharide biosynthesis protein
VLCDRGLLDSRRVLMPAELPDWMTISLKLVGVPEERMICYRADQEVLADDACVVGPVQFAAAPLVTSLQRRLWAAAGIDPREGPERRAVWLSRRRQHWRSLANAEVVESMAQRYGFEVIAPESLSLLDQVRLCAGAAVIAGPGGANLTNVMFARPNTQFLGLVSESNNYPGFIDLCAVLGLRQRWLFGRADPRKSRGGPLHESFEIDLDLLKNELERLVSTH